MFRRQSASLQLSSSNWEATASFSCQRSLSSSASCNACDFSCNVASSSAFSSANWSRSLTVPGASRGIVCRACSRLKTSSCEYCSSFSRVSARTCSRSNRARAVHTMALVGLFGRTTLAIGASSCCQARLVALTSRAVAGMPGCLKLLIAWISLSNASGNFANVWYHSSNVGDRLSGSFF